MAVRLSTGARNALLGTSGFKELFNGGKINIYSGAQPASADYTEPGTLLVTITEGSGTAMLDFGTAAAGVLPKESAAWSGLGVAAGVAGWFRLYGTAGTSGSSSSEIRVDGNVGISGADMTMSNTSIAVNQVVTVDSFNVTQPAQ